MNIFGYVVAAVMVYLGQYWYAAIVFASTLYAQEEAKKAKKRMDDAARAAEDAARFRNVTIRSPVAARQVVVGEARTGGVITFIYLSADKQHLHLVVTLAGHVSKAIEEIYFDEVVVPINGAGDVTGTYAGVARIRKSLGDEAGQPFPELVTETAGLWSDAHRQTGCTKIYVRLTFSEVVFPYGLPNISAVVKGLKVYDPRPSPGVTEWSQNPALIAAHILNNEDYGLGAPYGTEIDEAALGVAADSCEERVPVAFSATFTASAATDLLTLAAGLAYPVTGAQLRVDTGGTLPAPLTRYTIYYWIAVDSTLRTGKLASSKANALLGIAINLTSAGSGTLTITSCGPFTGNASTDEIAIAEGSRVPLTGQGVEISGLTFTNTAALGFDFVSSGSLTDGYGNTLTFTRSGSATFIGASGYMEVAAANTLRRDFDPLTLVCKGALLEEGRTNVAWPSEDFTHENYSTQGAEVSLVGVTNPYGGPNAALVSSIAGAGYHRIYGGALGTLSAGSKYSQSYFIKKGNQRYASVGDDSDAVWHIATFDFDTETVVVQANCTARLKQKLQGNWYEVVLTFTRTNTSPGNVLCSFGPDGASATAQNYTSNGTENGYWFAVQHELGDFSTSYIPTSFSAVARGADVPSTLASGFFNATEGTLVAEFSVPLIAPANQHIACFDDGSGNESIKLRLNATTGEKHFVVVDGGVTQVDSNTGAALTDNILRLAAVYKLNDFAVSADGAAVVTDSAGTIPTITHLQLGHNNVAQFLNGHLRAVAYYASRLTNVKLVEAILGQRFYAIRKQNRAIKLALTAADAIAGTAVNLLGNGTGTLAVFDEPRYSANGLFKVSSEPMDVINKLMLAMAGSIVATGNTWWVNAGKWYAPTVTLTESDFVGMLAVQSGVSRSYTANAVKGIFMNPDALWQQSEFPSLVSASYIAEDSGERIWRDLDLSDFVTSPSQAQRLAKIELLRTRQALTFVSPFKLSAYGLIPGRSAAVTVPRYGWSAKEFEVKTMKLQVTKEGAIQLEYGMREGSALLYDWATSEEQAHDIAANTTLPSPFPAPIEGLALASGTAQLFIALDGTVHSRILATWTAVTDYRVINGGRVEIEFKPSVSSTWQQAPSVKGSDTQSYLSPVDDGVSYDVRVRPVTIGGSLPSAGGGWTTLTGHIVTGKTALPSNVLGFSAAQQAQVVLFSCDRVSDADLDSIEVRYIETGGTWANASPLCNILRGETTTTAGLAPGTWDVLAKAKDTSGNYSATEARVNIEVTNSGYTNLNEEEQAPGWLGLKTNVVEHWSGVITPDSQSLASELGWEVFDQFVPNAYADCYYTTPEIDTGADGFARIRADIVSVLGPGETSGVANPVFQADHRLAAAGYDGFENWIVGTATFRYLKGRVYINTSLGKPVISGFKVTADTVPNVENFVEQVIQPGGTTLTFGNLYRRHPVVQVTPVGAAPRIPGTTGTSLTTTTVHLFDTSDVDAGGTANVTITGP